MKQRPLQIAVVAALVVLAVVLRNRECRPETPEATVSAFFEAAASGDDGLYLSLVAGDLRRSLRDVRTQRGADAFRGELARSVSGVKGRAMTRADNAPAGYVAIDVEHVFVERNEQQRLLLAPRGNGWVIEAIGDAETVKPLVPYGTPVVPDSADESVPDKQ